MPAPSSRRSAAPEPAQLQYKRILRADIRERFEGMDVASQVATTALITQLGIRPAGVAAGVYSPAEAGACPFGWVPLFERALRRLVKQGWNREQVQVRQKGGELRVVVREAPTPMRTIIERAKVKSRKRCAVCGQPADGKRPGLCGPHRALGWPLATTLREISFSPVQSEAPRLRTRSLR